MSHTPSKFLDSIINFIKNSPAKQRISQGCTITASVLIAAGFSIDGIGIGISGIFISIGNALVSIYLLVNRNFQDNSCMSYMRKAFWSSICFFFFSVFYTANTFFSFIPEVGILQCGEIFFVVIYILLFTGAYIVIEDWEHKLNRFYLILLWYKLTNLLRCGITNVRN